MILDVFASTYARNVMGDKLLLLTDYAREMVGMVAEVREPHRAQCSLIRVGSDDDAELCAFVVRTWSNVFVRYGTYAEVLTWADKFGYDQQQ
jgi:hypothetical protein